VRHFLSGYVLLLEIDRLEELLTLLEQLEGPLLRLVALAGQKLQRFLAGHHLLAADNATVLVLHQVLLGQTTRGVLSSAVEHLSLGANGNHIARHLLYF
jgi:hypothetical protein